MNWDLAGLAPWTYLIVGLLAAVMAWLSYKSYRNTGNIRLMFVFVAFVAMFLKSLIVIGNEWRPTHPIDYHTLLAILATLDVLIVLLFFIPFLGTPKRQG